MSDSEESTEQSVQQVVREMTPEVEALLQQGQMLLTGPALVQLMVPVEDALTPQEAVALVVQRIASSGFNTFTFAVTDKLSGEDFFVRAGQLLTLDEVQAAQAQDPDEGREQA